MRRRAGFGRAKVPKCLDMTPDDATIQEVPPLNELIPSLRPATGSVYHYTSPEAFHPIMATSRLWVSQASSLNDPSDVRAGWERVKKSLKKYATEDSQKRKARDDLLGFVDNPYGDAQRNIFVLSASTRGDDANQWRLYGGGGLGYCVEFDTSQRLAVVASGRKPDPDPAEFGTRMPEVASTTPWLSVIYGQRQLDRYVGELIEHTAKASEPDTDGLDPNDIQWDEYQETVGEQIRDAIAMLVALVKSPAYRGEQEARVVARVALPVQQSFRPVPGRGVISYLALGTAPDPDTANHRVISREDVRPLPVRSVRCGPLLYPESSSAKEHRETIRTFLRECFQGDGRDITVKRSKTTLRP